MKNFDLLVKRLVVEYWQQHHRPLLLSQLPPILNKDLDSDAYKDLISQRGSLKGLLKETQKDGGYKLVEHPKKKAKVGLIPEGESFDFETEGSVLSSSFYNEAGFRDNDIEGFIRILASLSPEELRGVQLPASLVVRLWASYKERQCDC